MPENVDRMIKDGLDELKTLLDHKGVVGEPVKVDEHTILPLFSVGFGFGSGAGSGAPEANAPEGTGAGMGAGGGVKPVAVVIVSPDGVRVERIKGGSGMDRLGEAIGKAIGERAEGGGKPS